MVAGLRISLVQKRGRVYNNNMEHYVNGAPYARFAELYDLLMQDVDYGGWVDYLHALIQAHNRDAGTVLDCGCGTGSITLGLAAHGYRMTGLDSSADMLAKAQEKARRRGLHIPFIQGDMRRILLHRPVDVIVSACDGVNYLTSLEAVRAFFLSAYQALKPGGLLLFDCSSRYKLARVLHGNTYAEALEDCAYIWYNSYDETTALCEMELTCFQKKGMLYARCDEVHVQRAHTAEELLFALEEAGFQKTACFGAFGLEPPGETAERIQLCAVRL